MYPATAVPLVDMSNVTHHTDCSALHGGPVDNRAPAHARTRASGKHQPQTRTGTRT